MVRVDSHIYRSVIPYKVPPLSWVMWRILLSIFAPVAGTNPFPEAQPRNISWWIWSGSCLCSKEVPMVLSRMKALWMLLFFFDPQTSKRLMIVCNMLPVHLLSVDLNFRIHAPRPRFCCFVCLFYPLMFFEKGTLDLRHFPYRRILGLRCFFLHGAWGSVIFYENLDVPEGSHSYSLL